MRNIFPKIPTTSQLRQEARNNWSYWRLCIDSNGSFNAQNYEYVFNHMTPFEIEEANTAMDLQIEEINRRLRNNKK